MHFTFAAALVAAALLLPNPAEAKDAPVVSLARASKWEMNYTPDTCQLMARFGVGQDSMILALTREHPGDAFSFQLFGSALKYNELQAPVDLAFGNETKPKRYSAVSLTVGADKLPAVRIAELRIDGLQSGVKPERNPAISPATEAGVSAIVFRRAGGKLYRLETGSMGPPLAAMRICTTDLVRAWGYDPEIENTLRRRPVPVGSPAGWVRMADFPQGAQSKGHNGLVRFRLDVAANGIPTGCRVLYRTDPDEFADHSCKLLLQRARFNPALDAAGKPVKSYYINSIMWLAGGW